MDYLQIIGMILAAPLVIIIIVAASMIKSEARRIEKLKQRSDKKKGRRS